MKFDLQKLYEAMLIKYRQRLDVAVWELEQAEAKIAQQARRIDELTASSEAEQPPKPSPPPTN